MHHQNKIGLKVSHFLIYYSKNYKGGIQKYVEKITDEQNKIIRTQIVTTSAFSAKNNDFRALRAKSWGIVLRTPISPRLVWAAQQEDADLLHFHGPNPLLDLAARAAKKPYVITIHNSFPLAKGGYYLANAVAKKLFWQTLQKSKKIFIHQENFLESLQLKDKKTTTWRKKIKIIPPGVDHAIFQPGTAKRKNNIVFLAHVRPEKGLHILKKSLFHLKNREELSIELLITSSYPGNYAEKEIEAIQKIMNKKCVLMENPSSTQIRDALQTAGCFVCPSIGLESWNLALLEAAACGAALVRSDLPGLSWLQPPACLVARAGNPLDLAEKITLALAQKETLGKEAARAAQKFSWKQTSQQLINEYHDLLQS